METQSPSDDAKSKLSTAEESPGRQALVAEEDTDVYILLQGPAHIIIEGDTVQVAFLDESGKRKPPINLLPIIEENTKVIKPLFLDLIIECDKAKYENGELTGFFPTTYNEITKTPVNMPNMTSTGPPTGSGSGTN
ncbi:hypothetical protein [Spirosoma endophyticum]|uniref:Uncharacterized protein n=1 Tax=Spirosoma endophyticum TaxID=662367 RepID=A0A1I1IPI2_9BACT|nr:hypothetical protein [Spirosoma endophyticum]SFC38187.1 hypothetical protein SAMN05216167_101991 [Spirosoma endophyticum]